MRTMVLVKGVSDELALTLTARRSGRDLKPEGRSHFHQPFSFSEPRSDPSSAYRW